MLLRRMSVGENSPFLGKALKESGIRDKYRCLVVGIEKADGTLHVPDPHIPLADGDTIWIVGENSDIQTMMSL